jgi:hypothetical protein
MKKIVLLASVLMVVIVAAGFWAGNQVPAQEGVSHEVSISISATLPETFLSYPSAVRSRIFLILKEQGLIGDDSFNPTLEDIQQLSFAMPGEVGYGTNPKWEIFEEKKDGKATLGNIHEKISQNFENGRFYISLSNRIEGLGSKQPELMAIFPHFPSHLCERAIGKVFKIPEEGLIIPISDPPNLISPPAIAQEKNIGIVPLIESWPYEDMIMGCYRDKNDVHYYYQVLFIF